MIDLLPLNVKKMLAQLKHNTKLSQSPWSSALYLSHDMASASAAAVGQPLRTRGIVGDQ